MSARRAAVSRAAALALLAGLALGCTELAQVGGVIAGQQAYQETYNREYRAAKKRGATDAEAQAAASRAAEGKATKQQQLFAGVGDVTSSAGEIDDASERAIGESLALEGFRRYGLPVEDEALQRYVNLVGAAVARNGGRPDLPYRFVVVKSPLYNAFACPGGIVFVSSTLVKAMRDEAELAGVLAHEVGHVTHRHALQSIRRAKFFEGVGKITAATMKGGKGQQFQSMIGDLQAVLFDKGLDKGMEYEADQAAVETAYRTGYDPAAFTRVLEMLRREEAGAKKEGSWFGTHPPIGTRIEKTSAQTAGLADAAGLARVAERFAKYVGRVP